MEILMLGGSLFLLFHGPGRWAIDRPRRDGYS